MAKSGIYKSDVKQARATLVAQNKHPSVDAIRIALGNTGSKTTIHKYIKELEAEQSIDLQVDTLTGTLSNLVAQLAAQLKADSDLIVRDGRAQFELSEKKLNNQLAAMSIENSQLQQSLAQITQSWNDEVHGHQQTRDRLQQETIARYSAEQEVGDLKERLVENTAHLHSLEEKHVHAREALEHYRQSVKEQRDQDLRRHEQQVQELQGEMRKLQQSAIIKQEEITRLNRESAGIVADLSHAQRMLHDEQSKNRHAAEKLEAMNKLEERSVALAGELEFKIKLIEELQVALTDSKRQIDTLTKDSHQLEIANATAQAALLAHQHISEDLRNALLARKANL